jgi:hypothetical protein
VGSMDLVRLSGGLLVKFIGKRIFFAQLGKKL